MTEMPAELCYMGATTLGANACTQTYTQYAHRYTYKERHRHI